MTAHGYRWRRARPSPAGRGRAGACTAPRPPRLCKSVTIRAVRDSLAAFRDSVEPFRTLRPVLWAARNGRWTRSRSCPRPTRSRLGTASSTASTVSPGDDAIMSCHLTSCHLLSSHPTSPLRQPPRPLKGGDRPRALAAQAAAPADGVWQPRKRAAAHRARLPREPGPWT